MTLIIAAKKHQTEVKNCEKKMPVTMHEIAISTPNTHIRRTDEIKNGMMVTIR